MKYIKIISRFLCAAIISAAQPMVAAVPCVKTPISLSSSIVSWCSHNKKTLIGLGSLAVVGGVYCGYRYWNDTKCCNKENPSIPNPNPNPAPQITALAQQKATFEQDPLLEKIFDLFKKATEKEVVAFKKDLEETGPLLKTLLKTENFSTYDFNKKLELLQKDLIDAGKIDQERALLIHLIKIVDTKKICTILHQTEKLHGKIPPYGLIEELIRHLSQEQTDEILFCCESELIARCLFSYGAQVNKWRKEDYMTPSLLYRCARFSSMIPVLRVLVEQPGVDFSTQGYSHQTALELAADSGNVEAVKLLLKHGQYSTNKIKEAFNNSQKCIIPARNLPKIRLDEDFDCEQINQSVRKQMREAFNPYISIE